ncbi:DUF58 domain-containing protein [Xylanimonas allomyrinae]|uniref:DUF58 domain-containing protein n=1 Tax=Xylanimonas allomyrinae TaxID=2509459 RepID=A0A4P6EIK3_9MICO|nr:DUF58 domain-containing protein [Xylanimonas allomyrinae]QAY62332.1 DUF58 domain-containing protein [Xylanimonas allomyrinae]
MTGTLRRIARVRPTRRGVTLAVVGVVLTVLGGLLRVPDAVGLGAAALGAVAVAWITHGVQRLDAGRGALAVTRQVTPDPVVRGQEAATQLLVGPARPTAAAFERLARIRLSEQASHELAGSSGVRARVSARPDRIQVRYAIHPARRGHWPLGPLLTTRTDAFGLVRTTQPLGAPTVVTVWPRTTELAVHTGLLGDLENVGTGARRTAPDDAVLREYVAGDDPRRVHWPTAARQGRLMVRTDEAAGVRPVSVVLDRALLPAPGEQRSVAGTLHGDGEWAVELVASLACSFLDAGHPVRLVPTARAALGDSPRFVTGARTGRPALLDATVDLAGPRTAADADAALAETARSLRAGRTPGEVMVAVLHPQSTDALGELAALSTEGASCWALLVARRATDAATSVAVLRSAGWRVATTSPGTSHDRAWSALAERAE